VTDSLWIQPCDRWNVRPWHTRVAEIVFL